MLLDLGQTTIFLAFDEFHQFLILFDVFDLVPHLDHSSIIYFFRRSRILLFLPLLLVILRLIFLGLVIHEAGSGLTEAFHELAVLN